MEEKIIIKSQHYNLKWLFIVALISINVVAIPIIPDFCAGTDELIISYAVLLLLDIVIILIMAWLLSHEMVVTDKRIYGRVAWGKRVDLPIDSISSTATLHMFKGVSVSTASGRIKFLLIKNASEMYEIINNILIERQKKDTPNIVTVEKKTDTPDDLIKLKELLDMEIITQEEFEAKKKQILGLQFILTSPCVRSFCFICFVVLFLKTEHKTELKNSAKLCSRRSCA